MLSHTQQGADYEKEERERIYVGTTAASARVIFLLSSTHIPIWHRRVVIFILPVSQSYLQDKIKFDE